jgi:hypothetical protein
MTAQGGRAYVVCPDEHTSISSASGVPARFVCFASELRAPPKLAGGDAYDSG